MKQLANSSPEVRARTGRPTKTHGVAMSDLPKNIGKYKINALVGVGSISTVYAGHDPTNDREVAIKICRIPGEASTEIRRLARKAFYNEAHCASVLIHPNILKIYDAGEDHGEPYIVMEYVDGAETLAGYTSKDNLLPVKTVLKTLYKCAKGLDYAHRKGIVHRDIKPTNIMLTPSGEVKIADFGLAYSANSSITQFTGLVGSIRYVSPEQIQEDPVNAKSDLYSLGVVAFELLTGQLPVKGKTIKELARNIVSEPAPLLRELRPDLPSALEDVLMRLLQKNPDGRQNSAQELVTDFASVFGELSKVDSLDSDLTQDINNTKKFEMCRKLEFFKDFSNSELREVVQACQWEHYQKGEPIVREGEEDQGLFVLAEGQVEVSIMGRAICVLRSGACFGEMNYLSKASRTATVTAKGGVYVLKTDADDIRHTPPSCQLRFKEALIEVLLQRLTVTSDRFAQLIQSLEMH